MFSNIKTIWVAGLFLLMVVAAALGGVMSRRSAAPFAVFSGSQAPDQNQKNNLPSNVFLPAENKNIVRPESGYAGASEPLNSSGQVGADVKTLSLEDVRQKIAQALPSVSDQVVGVPLPAVSDNEIAIDPNGAKNAMEYLAYFAAHTQDASFDHLEFNRAETDKNGAKTPPLELVLKVLNGDASPAVADSIGIWKDFVLASNAYLKKIKVTGDAIAISKAVIGINMLEVGLLDQARAVVAGQATNDGLRRSYDQLMAAAAPENRKIMGAAGLATDTANDFFSRVLRKVADFLGLKPISFAQAGVPFGGVVIYTGYPECSCSAGFYVFVSLPFPAPLFVSYIWYASPALFLYKLIHIGGWILGTYVPAPIPCFVPVVIGCVASGEVGFPPIIAGTSL